MSDFIILLIVIYLVPLTRLILIFVPAFSSTKIISFNSMIGRYEAVVRLFRDYVLIFFLVYRSGVEIYDTNFILASLYIFFIGMSIFAYVRYRYHLKRSAEFAVSNLFIHPRDFFRVFYSGFGIIPVKFDKIVCAKIDPTRISFSNHEPVTIRLWPIIAGAFNTFSLSRIIIAALKYKGHTFCREVAFALSGVWGGRIAQLTRLSIETEGLEKLSKLEGKFVFVLNHKSFIDFAIAPFVFSGVRPADREHFDLRYLAARDHFIDNFFLRRMMGQAMLAIGTIFVDRKKKKTGPKIAVTEAVESMVNSGADIVMFPQGTRAHGNISQKGKRIDAGYYTTGSKERLMTEGGHLKKGAAYIAANVMMYLKKHEREIVNIVPVGLIGTAAVVPKGSLRVQTGAVVRVRVGEPITIKKEDVLRLKPDDDQYRSFVNNIHQRIDDGLKEVLGIHSELEQRFFTDIRKFLPSVDFEYVAVSMKTWRGEDYLIYTILDCIYTTPPKGWQNLLRELCHLMMGDSPREAFVRFKGRVVGMIG